MKTASSLLVATSLLFAGGSMCAHANDPESLTEGLTYTDGIFFPTHTISGMTYNPETKNYVTSSSASEPTSAPATLGYPDASHLPESGPLLDSFNEFGFDPDGFLDFLNALLPESGFDSLASWSEDEGASLERLALWYGYSAPALDYFNGLSAAEQASLYRALASGSDPAASSLLGLLAGDSEQRASSLLSSLPSGEAGPALNQMDNLHYLDLSGLNIAGFDAAGKSLQGVNFVGSNVTIAQLNAAHDLRGANLAGLDLAGLETAGRSLDGVNFVGTTVTSAQLNAASDLRYSNLSGLQTLSDLDTAGKSLDSVNFVGSNVSSAQLNAASDLRRTNLSGLDLAGFDAAGKSLVRVNLSGANVTASQLVSASDLRYVNLVGTGITAADLESVGVSPSVLLLINF